MKKNLKIFKRSLIVFSSLFLSACYIDFGNSDSFTVSSFSSSNNVSSTSSSSSKDSTSEISSSSAISSSSSNSSQTVSSSSIQPVVNSEFEIYFLELGNWNTGDSIFIKAGDNDILIDAGSKYSSASTIMNFIDAHCEDKKLEYVIATHAHEDHIAGFSGTGADAKDGILYKYEIGTIIEFAKHKTTSNVYQYYVEARNYAVSKGAKCYTALQAYNDSSLRKISLGQDMYMETLYQKFYEQSSSEENNFSVCTLFTCKDEHYLFTGDLETAGERSLIEKNNIPHCKLYKAGHHGSDTSSCSELMAKVQPDIVCVCCCCGSNEYSDDNATQFPSQTFIDNVGKYTDKIYVTTLSTSNEKGAKTFTSMNGIICFKSNGITSSIHGSNNDTKLKDTEWFKKNRSWKF